MSRLGDMAQMRWLRVGSGVLGLTAVLLLFLIAFGVFDPRPVGELVWTDVPHTLTIPPGEQHIFWLAQPLPADDFTVRTNVRHQSGELDSGAGVVLGDGCTAVIIALSPLGYATIHQNATHTCSPTTDHRPPITEMPWQPWPHVRTGEAANELWVTVADGQMMVRINRELLWVGDIPIQPTQMGWYGKSFGGTAVFYFSSPPDPK